MFPTNQAEDGPSDSSDDSPEDSQGGDRATCSSKGCHEFAAWALLWNNPKIHTEDRRKTWVACDEHRDTLGDFLRARSFLRDVEPLDGGSRQ